MRLPVAALQNELRAKIRPGEKQPGGLLVVPEVLSPEESKAQAEAHNANARDPSTYVNHKSEEFAKAVRGIPTALGEAILASQGSISLNAHRIDIRVPVQVKPILVAEPVVPAQPPHQGNFRMPKLTLYDPRDNVRRRRISLSDFNSRC